MEGSDVVGRACVPRRATKWSGSLAAVPVVYRRDCVGLGGFVTAERSQNFGFLSEGHEPVFHQLAVAAEQVFAYDPNTTLVKVRQLVEAYS
jgi:hypothetical protein